MNKVVVITGPTAVGKTKLSLEIAKRLNTDIINSDAYQIYKKMDIATAKPTKQELSLVKHHFIDFLDPSCEYSIADYQKEVRNLIDEMHENNKVPLLVGGSGLYIDSVIKDYRFTSEKRDIEKESLYDYLTNEELHEKLRVLDCELAKTIHPNNRHRVLRAISLATDEADKSDRSHRDKFVYDTLVIFLSDDREKLYDRINKRVDKMLDDGLIEEIKSIGLNNFSKTSSKAIGYKEMIDCLNGDKSLDDAIDEIKKNSRRYAKRQFTWFKNKTDSVVINVDVENFDNTINEVQNLIVDFLGKN